MRVINGSLLGWAPLLAVGTVHCVQTLKDNDYNHGTGGKVIVELDETKGMSVVLLLNNTDGRCGRRWCKPGVEGAALNPDGSITYMYGARFLTEISTRGLPLSFTPFSA
jgi:hypothetical protein